MVPCYMTFDGARWLRSDLIRIDDWMSACEQVAEYMIVAYTILAILYCVVTVTYCTDNDPFA